MTTSSFSVQAVVIMVKSVIVSQRLAYSGTRCRLIYWTPLGCAEQILNFVMKAIYSEAHGDYTVIQLLGITTDFTLNCGILNSWVHLTDPELDPEPPEI